MEDAIEVDESGALAPPPEAGRTDVRGHSSLGRRRARGSRRKAAAAEEEEEEQAAPAAPAAPAYAAPAAAPSTDFE